MTKTVAVIFPGNNSKSQVWAAINCLKNLEEKMMKLFEQTEITMETHAENKPGLTINLRGNKWKESYAKGYFINGKKIS